MKDGVEFLEGEDGMRTWLTPGRVGGLIAQASGGRDRRGSAWEWDRDKGDKRFGVVVRRGRR